MPGVLPPPRPGVVAMLKEYAKTNNLLSETEPSVEVSPSAAASVEVNSQSHVLGAKVFYPPNVRPERSLLN